MSTAPTLPPNALPADVLSALLNVSLTGVIVFRPVSAPGQPEVLTDLTYVHLNPAAQRMLRLPECPPESFVTLHPTAHETGLLAFYLDTFRAGTPGRYDVNYQHDGLEPYFHLAAQRSGELLVVSFTDTTDQQPNALSASQPRRQAEHDHTRMRGLNEKLHQLNKDLESRVADRTHDLDVLVAGLHQAHTEAAQQQLFELFEQAHVSIAILRGPRYVFEMANPMTSRLLGRPVEELLGQGLFEAVPEAAGLGFEQQLDKVLQTGVPYVAYESPSRIVRDGRVKTMYWSFVYQPLRDPDGQITGVIAVTIDATGQVLARQRAKALQAELRAVRQQQLRERTTSYQVFEQTPALIALLRGPRHRFEFYNTAYQQLFSGRELRGRTVTEVAPEIVSQGFMALLDNVYRTGTTYFGTEMPFVVEQPGGQPPRTHYFNFTYQRFEEGGQPAGISVFAFDVTEQVLARQDREIERQRQQELFEQLPVAMAVFAGPEYVVEVCNPRLEALWGRAAEEVLHRPVFEVMPEVRDQGLRELLDAVRATGIPYVAHEMPVQVLRDGRLTDLYVNFVYHPLRDAQGNITAVVAVVLDVSEQVAARQGLAEANAELTAANARLTRTNVDLDTFIYTASHDFRQPIANIEGLLNLLREELPNPAAHQPAGLMPGLLAMMQRAVERFQLTIAQLTDVSRLQQAQHQPLEAVGLAALVEDVRQDLTPAMVAVGTRLTVAVAAHLTVVFTPKNLRSIIYNLLSNAVKYHDPTRPSVVHLRARATPAATVLEVEDNGLGLSPTQQGRLYGMFQRQHDHVEGSGIGLYMVKRIVENAGGTIVVQSATGVGTTFTVTLPHPVA